MDCYRLEGEEDDLGFDEYFEDNAIIVIEWSKFIKDFLPPNHLTININVKMRMRDKYPLKHMDNIMH